MTAMLTKGNMNPLTTTRLSTLVKKRMRASSVNPQMINSLSMNLNTKLTTILSKHLPHVFTSASDVTQSSTLITSCTNTSVAASRCTPHYPVANDSNQLTLCMQPLKSSSLMPRQKANQVSASSPIWRYGTVKASIGKPDSLHDICADSGCGASLVDRDFLAREVPDFAKRVKQIADPIKVKGIGGSQLETKDYLPIEFQLPGRLVHRNHKPGAHWRPQCLPGSPGLVTPEEGADLDGWWSWWITAEDALLVLHHEHIQDEYEPDLGHHTAIHQRLRIGKESTK